MGSKSCYSFKSSSGVQTRTRSPARQPALPQLCGVHASQCNQAWGGGRECDSSYYQWSQTRACNDDPTQNHCPIDCEVGQWGHWSPCTKKCGSGGTYRTRKVTVSPMFGGAACPALREPVHGLTSCNEHKCASFTQGALCHESTCTVKLSHCPFQAQPSTSSGQAYDQLVYPQSRTKINAGEQMVRAETRQALCSAIVTTQTQSRKSDLRGR